MDIENRRIYSSSSLSLLVLSVSVLITSCVTTREPSFATQAEDLYSQAIFEMSEVASEAYGEKRWAEAARHYEQLTNRIPYDAYVWFRLANTYVQQGEYDQAIQAYEKSIHWDSLQPKPWFNLSTVYLMNAKSAMLQSSEYLRETDPAQELIRTRVQAIDSLMNVSIGEPAK